MKLDRQFGRSLLIGALGDTLDAVLCGAGHNLHPLINGLRLLYVDTPLLMREFITEKGRTHAPLVASAA